LMIDDDKIIIIYFFYIIHFCLEILHQERRNM
jgi:hypothetical protein